jgi:hypothetical protein
MMEIQTPYLPMERADTLLDSQRSTSPEGSGQTPKVPTDAKDSATTSIEVARL